MLLAHENWYLGYQQILADVRGNHANNADSTTTSSSKYALILCHADVDAMAGARMLCYLLRADHVNYVLQPCWTYQQLERTVKTSVANGNCPSSVILLNVGGSRNMTKLFGANNGGLDKGATKVYILDARRPLHLANVHAANHVVVFWDQDSQELPSDGDDLSGRESSSDSESESESDDEGEAEFQDDSDNDNDNEDDDGDEMQFGDNDRGNDKENNQGHDDDDDASASDHHKKKGDNVLNVTAATVDETMLQDDDDDHLDYDGEDEADDHPHLDRAMKQKTTTTTTTAMAGLEDVGADDDDNLTVPTATPTTLQQTQPPMSPRTLHRKRRDQLRLYYADGSYHGSPCAYVLHRIASQQRFWDVADLLWLAIVGVTDAFLQARIDITGYTALALDLQRAVNKLFPPVHDVTQRVEQAVYAEELLLTQGNNNNNNTDTSGANNSNDSNNPQQQFTKLTFSDHGRILAQKDYKFFLLRHTSLLDAMTCSPYLSTQLQLWTPRGRQGLHELLARMGYPLDQCRQPYAFMKPSLRRRLYQQMSRHAPEFGLDHFEFTSFFRVTGYQSLLSASDMSYAVGALLECPLPQQQQQLPNGNKPSDEIAGQEQQEEWDRISFNQAYDALGNLSSVGGYSLQAHHSTAGELVNGGNLSGGLGTGIRWAMALQKSILTTAVGLETRKAIVCLRHFRYAYITCTTNSTGNNALGAPAVAADRSMNNNNTTNNAKQHHVFAKPLALCRLAHYLMDMNRATGKWVGEKKSRPLVLMAEKPSTNTYLVVGYEMPERAGHFTKNRFGHQFQLVSQTMAGTNEDDAAVARFDSFDAHVVEVGGNRVQRFIEQLHYLMDSV